MKTNRKFLFFAAFAALTLGFASCTDKDDGEDYAPNVVGEYTGTLEMDGMPIASDVEINVTKTAKNKVELAMNQVIAGMPVNINADSNVTLSGEKYAVSGKATYNYSVEVTINGTVDKTGNAIFDIVLSPSPVGDGTLDIVFKGKK
ncbi:MAG: calycin-like domain-containing protein [Bacteroidales bacterium]|jgi:hypothetical protein|nr:calycin-like domain-containing protein [Bacteroidales bacterium]